MASIKDPSYFPVVVNFMIFFLNDMYGFISWKKREAIEGDRRKTKLVCTTKAQPVIREGQQLQQEFVDHLFDNITQKEKEIFIKVMKTMDKNLDDILKGGN